MNTGHSTPGPGIIRISVRFSQITFVLFSAWTEVFFRNQPTQNKTANPPAPDNSKCQKKRKESLTSIVFLIPLTEISKMFLNNPLHIKSLSK